VKAMVPANLRVGAVHWLGQRKDLDAGPDVLVLLADPPNYPAELNAILASDSTELQRQARLVIEEAYRSSEKLTKAQYAQASAELDRRIVDPANFRSQEDFEKRVHAFATDRSDEALLASNLDQYVATMRRKAAAMEKLLSENGEQKLAPYGRGRLGTTYHVPRPWPRGALPPTPASRSAGSL
jgi:hypothetical protein